MKRRAPLALVSALILSLAISGQACTASAASLGAQALGVFQTAGAAGMPQQAARFATGKGMGNAPVRTSIAASSSPVGILVQAGILVVGWCLTAIDFWKVSHGRKN